MNTVQAGVERPRGGTKLCPVCGSPMSEHLIDRSGLNAVLHCPAPPRPDWRKNPDAPLNELGMIRQDG